MAPDQLLSKTIHFLRFPLIFSVVVSHTNFVGTIINGVDYVQTGMYPIYDFIYCLVKQELASFDVTTFFFFAGFLFFYKADFTQTTYVNKLKNRVHTLLIPYLFWNALVLAMMIGGNLLLTGLTSGSNQLLASKSITEWLNMFWSYKLDAPVASQFWFIRDLMMMGIFSPLLYMAVRYLKWIWIPLVGCLWIAGITLPVTGFSLTAIFFFSLGAWFSIHKVNFATLFLPMRKVLLAVFLVLVGVNMALWYADLKPIYDIVHNINVLVGMAAAIGWVARGNELEKIHISEKIAGATFFVYAYHLLAVFFCQKVWLKLFQPVNEVSLVVGYFVIPVLIAAVGVGLYHLFHKISPRFTAIITGGR
jgi:hypothetical protein